MKKVSRTEKVTKKGILRSVNEKSKSLKHIGIKKSKYDWLLDYTG